MITSDRRGRLSTGRHAVSLVLALLLSSAPAHADGEADRAEALFQRARERMGQGDFAAACPMLEEAYSIDRGAGTLLALALCHEGNGQPATALREYRESLAMAVRAHRSDRVMLAAAHVQQLEASVPRIKVVPPSPDPADLSVTVDGAPIDRAAMSAGVLVDPGVHVIVASTPRTAPWRANVSVPSRPEPVVVRVPDLGGPAPAVADQPRERRSAGAVDLLGWGATGLGVVALGVGAFFGVAAFEQEGRSKGLCNGNECPPQGVNLNHEANRDATVSDVGFAVGGVALATGLILLLRPFGKAAPARPAPVSVHAWARAQQTGIGVTASW
jgi:hypothetical protein